MINPNDLFFIVLTINTSKKQFTRNNSCALSNHIPTSNNFEGLWEVCLRSLCATLKVVHDNVLKNPPGFMLIYTNMVTDKVMGDVTAPSLGGLPLLAKKSQAKITPV